MKKKKLKKSKRCRIYFIKRINLTFIVVFQENIIKLKTKKKKN